MVARRRPDALHRRARRAGHRVGHRGRPPPRTPVPGKPAPSVGPERVPAAAARDQPLRRTVAAGLPDGGVRLHDARSLRRLGDLPGIEDGQVLAIEFRPDGRAFGVTGEDGTVEVRDVATGRRVRPALRGLGEPVQAMAFSPDGGHLAVADLEGNFRMTRSRDRRGPPAAAARGVPDRHLVQPRRQDAGDRGRRARHRSCATAARSRSWPTCATPPGTRIAGSASRRTVGCWPSAPSRVHAAVGRRAPPASRPAAARSRVRRVQCRVLARRAHARDERIRRQGEPLGRRVASRARNASRHPRPGVGPLHPRRPPPVRAGRHRHGSAVGGQPGRVVAARVPRGGAGPDGRRWGPS